MGLGLRRATEEMKRGDEEKHLKAQCDVQNSLKINLLEKKKKRKKDDLLNYEV